MAALSEMALPRVVDLRQVRSADLDALLEEEVGNWNARLHWDFSPSAALVRRFVEIQALSGFALIHADRVIGYSYYVQEERKGLIGDCYVIDAFRSVEYENLLLGPALDALFTTPFIHRVESQLMMISHPLARPLPMGTRVQVHARNFMEALLAGADCLPVKEHDRIRIEPWSESDQDEAARVIAASYSGHIDSRINDQYRSPAGARRFLLNIVQYPGCGSFFKRASFVAIDNHTRRLCGICLSSLVQEQVGHITQICVTPEARGTGTGYSLIRRAMTALAEHGCTRASLTVTASNEIAGELYERVGFATSRKFAAYVWENR